MGRRPIIRDSILSVLRKSKMPLRFTEIREGVALELGRKVEKVGDQNISNNLSILVKAGQVEVKNIGSKNVYSPSNSFYKTKNKLMLKTILDEANLDEFYPVLEESSPPLAAYFEDLEKLTNPLRNKIVQHFSPELNNWSEPIDLIRRRMMESFTDLTNEDKQGIAKLLSYAYWYGVKQYTKEYGIHPLDKTLDRCQSFAQTCIQNATERKDFHRVEAEYKIIEILGITKKFLSIKNLKELLLFIESNSMQVKKLQNEMLQLTGEYMSAGETIFDSFKQFHYCTLVGLAAAKLVPEKLGRQYLPPKLRYLMSYSEVWDEVISSIIREFNEVESLEQVGGDEREVLKRIAGNKRFLLPLIDLPSRSRMFIFYVWGYKEIFEVSDREFLPNFEEWIQALKDGNLDHRSWIFDEKSVNTLISTYKDVRRGKIPENGIVDIEHWTISNLYSFHPRGKEPDFWRELLVEVNKRIQHMPMHKKLSRDIEAVLEGGY